MIVHLTPRDKAYFLIECKPIGYPINHPEEPINRFPILKVLTREDIPEAMCAFNDLGRALDPINTLIHFHKDDSKFHDMLREPLLFGSKYGHFKGLLSPDITLSDGMSEWERIKNTYLSRAVAATWESQGITVVPLLRWRFVSDCAFVVAGIPKHSVIAVSSYGSVRDAELRQVFIDGLREIVKRLEPIAILVYGTALKNIQDIVGPNIEVIMYPTSTEKLRLAQSSIKDDEASRLF